MVHLEPLAVWSHAKYIQKPVVKVIGKENKVYLANGQTVDYDVLVINVGSRTRDSYTTPGVWEHALTTRPINDLLPKIENKENELMREGIIPDVVVVGGGAAGTELSFAFKARWTKYFGREINVRILTSQDGPIPYDPLATRKMVFKLMKDYRITIEKMCRVKEVTKNSVILEDGRVFKCDVCVWATGAEP